MTYQLYSQLIWTWIVVAVMAFAYLLRQNAPYGRHTRPGWGPTLDNRVGWFLMEFPVIVVFLAALLWDRRSISPQAALFSGCFLLHYINRSIVFPLRLRTRGKRMPWAIVFSAIGFNIVNGFSLGYFFGHFAAYSPVWWTDMRFLTGAALFCLGLAINWHSDNILIHLRKPGATGYAIPEGGLFRKISCPNLFGEIVEWTGYALMTWSLPGLAFAVWTAANLLPRALAHHRWYRATFADYPRERKAVIPFLW